MRGVQNKVCPCRLAGKGRETGGREGGWTRVVLVREIVGRGGGRVLGLFKWSKTVLQKAPDVMYPSGGHEGLTGSSMFRRQVW